MTFAQTDAQRPSLLCGCLVDLEPTRASEHFRRPDVDMLEWRLDLSCRKAGIDAVESGLSQLADSNRLPVLVTNRPVREGGSFDGQESARVDILLRAVDAGAEWVDLEQDVPQEVIDGCQSKGAEVLLSHHDFLATPGPLALRDLARRLASRRPDAIKIVTLARHPEDNLRVLELIAFAREECGTPAIAFCMGPLGRWSRAVCVLLGSPWTYVQLAGLGAAAPGQLTAEEMHQLLTVLRGDPPS